MWAEHLRQDCKPDAAGCLACLRVCFPFQRTDGSVRIQWSRRERRLFWLLTVGWIPRLFTPFCNETCAATECQVNLQFRMSEGGLEREEVTGPGSEQIPQHQPGLLTMSCPLRPTPPSRAFTVIHPELGDVLGCLIRQEVCTGPCLKPSAPHPRGLLGGDHGVHT